MRGRVMERRGSERVCVRLPVEAERDGRPVWVDLETVDLSAGGLSVEASGGAGPGGRFEWLSLSLPDGSPVKILAERAESAADAARAAYRIKYIYPRDRRRYESFVSAQLGRA